METNFFYYSRVLATKETILVHFWIEFATFARVFRLYYRTNSSFTGQYSDESRSTLIYISPFDPNAQRKDAPRSLPATFVASVDNAGNP
jgi:hypothetical protein